MILPTTLSEWLEHISHCHPEEIELGLARITAIAQSLHLLPFSCPVITVGGTNGKGSCVTTLTAIYRAVGYRTGSYFSPHLLHFNERIVINGTPVSDEALCAAFAAVEAVRRNRPLTYFEFVTLAALWLFKQQPLDVLILEVGLGGRLDAVNMVDADVAVITSIGLDHTEWLGDTLSAIAQEKAGIFRPGKIAVLGQKANLQVLHQLATTQDARIFVAFPTRNCTLLPTESVGIAEVVITQLQYRLPVAKDIMIEAIRMVTMHGRFQIIPGELTQVFDVAHNPQGAQWLAERCRATFKGRRIVAVWSSFQDKDLSGIVAPLRTQIAHWFIADTHVPRSASVAMLQAALEGWHIIQITAAKNIIQAYHQAIAQAEPGDVVLIFGGFAIITELLPMAQMHNHLQEGLING